MQKENKKNVIFVERSSRPSPFLVDIPKNLEKEEAERIEKPSFAGSIRKKINIFNYFTDDEQSAPSELTTINYIWPNKERITKIDLKDQLNNLYKTIDKKLSRLMIYPLTRLGLIILFYLARFLYQIIYYCVWLVSWVFRFIFFICKKILSLLPSVLSTVFKRISLEIKNFKIKSNNSKLTQEQAKIPEIGSIPLNKHDETDEAKLKIEKSKQKRFSFTLKNNRLKPVALFTLAAVIFVLPLKAFSVYNNINDVRGQVLGATESALSDMGKAARSLVNQDFIAANNEFGLASDNFLSAKNSINNIKKLVSILAPIVPNKDLQLANAADTLFAAGIESARLGNSLTSLLTVLSSEPLDIKLAIETFEQSSTEMKESADKLSYLIAPIDETKLSDEYKKQFKMLKDMVKRLGGSLDELHSLAVLTKAFLGWETDKRYLLVFQNNTEMRASGGFIGSYALVDFRKGKIINLEVPSGGSYDIEAGLYDMVKSPQALTLVSPRWYFRDANWWPDWPSSAKKLAWFFEKSNGPSVDGVLGITPTVLEKLLSIIGPINMRPDYDVIVDATNVWTILQTRDESRLGLASGHATGTDAAKYMPKKIIGELMTRILDELPAKLSKDTFVKTIKILEQCLKEKHILAYLYNTSLQNKIVRFGWGGKIKDTSRDYLMVVNTNIGGGKSDKKISQTIKHRSDIDIDGAIINTITIIRRHEGIEREQFSGVRNVDWLRVYVPQGSTLITASGFSLPDVSNFELPDKSWQDDKDILASEGTAKEHLPSGTKIYNELNKTVFANWSQVDPGETAVIILKYQLPFSFLPTPEPKGDWLDNVNSIFEDPAPPAIPYSLMVQKQPGSLGSKFTSQLVLPGKYKINWHYPDSLDISQGWVIEDVLTEDRYWAITAQ